MIKFSSPADADFSMLDEHAQDLIRRMGHSMGSRGALAVEDVQPALQQLRGAIDGESGQKPGDDSADGDAEPAVGLRQRAYPLLRMLERAAAANKPVLWGG